VGAHPIAVRRATLDDVDALAALHHDTVAVAYAEFFPPPAPSVAELRPLWEQDVRTAHAVFVAGDCVGSAVARADGSLGRVHVHPSHWGGGIGGALHDAAVAELRAHGHRRAELWVIDRNVRARGMYERRGWVLDPSQVKDYLGVREVRYVLDEH
jgi:GNAT superfamily N-acetyltransferase